VARSVGAEAMRQAGDLHLGSATLPRFTRTFVAGATEGEIVETISTATAQGLGRADLVEPALTIVREWCGELMELQRRLEAAHGLDAAQALLGNPRRSGEAAARYRERDDFATLARDVQRQIIDAEARAHARLAEAVDEAGRAALRRDQPRIFYAYLTRE
jgi:hypothetical protein